MKEDINSKHVSSSLFPFHFFVAATSEQLTLPITILLLLLLLHNNEVQSTSDFQGKVNKKKVVNSNFWPKISRSSTAMRT